MKLDNIKIFAQRNGMDAFLASVNEGIQSIDAVRFDEVSYKLENPDVAAAIENGDLPDGYTHWVTDGHKEARAGSGLSIHRDRKRRKGPLPDNPHIVLYSPISALSGLGAAGRGYAKALQYTKATVEVIDSTAVVYPHRKFPKIPDPIDKPDIVIIHHNADALNSFFNKVDRSLLDETYVIGIWVWELAAFRPEWIEHFAAVDEIWAPSDFAAEAIRLLAPSKVPVKTVPHVVEVELPTMNFSRAHFGIPEDTLVFLASFDISSGLRRKNPHAVVDAFQRAFSNESNVALVLKYHSGDPGGDEIRKLRKVADCGNIIVIDSLLSSEENLSLKIACDAFISCHRSEGFGLNIAEMICLGKPVVATSYSGNMQFCDEQNSYLVDFDLVEVTDGGPYPTGYVWAEPKIESITQELLKVKCDLERRSRDRSVGVSNLSKEFLPESVGTLIDKNIGEIIDATRDADFIKNNIIDFDFVWRHPFSLGSDEGCVSGEILEWPRISVIVPVYNVRVDVLSACVASVMAQTYPNWELCICDDASTLRETIEFINGLRGLDQRIKIKVLRKNLGIAGCSNAAVEFASGEFISFLDNDDTIEPNALFEFAKAIKQNPDRNIFYCDEDKISESGEYVDHYMKPDWSPEHLESAMYVLHMLTVKKSRFLELGGFRDIYTGAQDYDIALRLSLAGERFFHIPKVLYHWRMIPGSASAQVDAKPSALLNAKAALDEYAKAKFGPYAFADDGLLYGQFRVDRGRRVAPPVTLAITTNNVSRFVEGRGVINLAENLIRSIINKTNYP